MRPEWASVPIPSPHASPMFARRYAKLQGDQLRNIFTTRRRIIIAGITTAAVLGTGGAAFAYFAASGSGNGTATVGSDGTWTVAQTAITGGPLYPDGTTSETITFTVTNGSTGNQEFTSATATLPADGGGLALDANGNAIPGCKASWFTPAIASDPSLNQEIAGGGTTTVTVTVKMPTNETDNQTACEGTAPRVTLAIA
jgi:hypothetical protein